MQNTLKSAALALLSLLPGLALADSLPELQARFETTQCATPCKKPVKREWFMLREANQVELRDLNDDHSDLWRLQADGSLEYVYLMHGLQRAIDYAPVDLRLLGINASESKWHGLSQLLSREELDGMQKKAGRAYQGMATEIYKGKIGNIKTEVTWIPELAVPLKLQYQYPKHTVTVQLKQRYQGKLAQSKLPITPTTEATLQAYQHVDFTDIGDMEHDPVATAWLSQAKGAPGVHVHHHQAEHADEHAGEHAGDNSHVH